MAFDRITCRLCVAPGHNAELTWQLNINDEENCTILSSIDEIPSGPLAVEKQREECRQHLRASHETSTDSSLKPKEKLKAVGPCFCQCQL